MTPLRCQLVEVLRELADHIEVPCQNAGCEFPAGHEKDHPCGYRQPADRSPCRFCGAPEPCEKCWRPATVSDLKGLAAEADRSVDIERSNSPA